MSDLKFQHTAARRRLVQKTACRSIHTKFQHTAARRRLGAILMVMGMFQAGFNTQPPEGGWDDGRNRKEIQNVSTHSRPKAAGASQGFALLKYVVSTHSRPKAAGFIMTLFY